MAVATKLVAVPKIVVMMAIPSSAKASKTLRDYNPAFVHACQSMDATEKERIKDKWIIENIPLKPFSLVGQDGDGREMEYNAFSHCDNIKAMVDRTFQCKAIIPSKRPIEANACEANVCDDLLSLIYKSPHRQLLSGREFFEMDATVELLLNKDRLHEPQVKFVSLMWVWLANPL